MVFCAKASTGKSLVHLRNPMETVKWGFEKNCSNEFGPTGRMERDFSQGCIVIGQGGMAVN